MRAIIPFAWTYFILAAQGQPSAVRVVSGTVLNSATGVPIAGALVIVEPGPRKPPANIDFSNPEESRKYPKLVAPGSPQRVLTDQTGSFSFSFPDIMVATVKASRRGFRSEQRQDTATTHLNPDQMASAIVKLVPLGAVQGRVVNQDGEPVPGITVAAIHVNLRNGRRVISEGANKNTDDLGEYRLWDFSPGLIYLKVVGRRGTWTGVGGLTQMSLSDEAYGPMYYPAATTRAETQPLRIRAGETIQADFVVQGNKAYKIKGILQNLPPYTRPSVRLLRGDDMVGGRASINISNGSFEISDVTPGSYLVQAYSNNSTTPVLGEMPVTVGDGDVSGLLIAMNTGVDVSGTIEFPPESNGVRGVPRRFATVQAQHNAPDHLPFVATVSSQQVDGNGKFTLKNVQPGTYTISVFGGGVVASIESGASNVLSDGLTIGNMPVNDLKVILSKGLGSVECALDGADARAGFTFAAVRRVGSGVVTQLQPSGPEGTTIFGALAPGDYTIYAWPESRQVEYQSASALGLLSAYGVRVSVTEGAQEKVTVKSAPAEEQ
jgi:hypothetical protein